MKINDVLKQVDLSKRAIKYYEEQGLLSVSKDANGYRNYTDANILRLKTISRIKLESAQKIIATSHINTGM